MSGAIVVRLPTAAALPVVNPKHAGRWRKSIHSLNKARQKRELAALHAKEEQQGTEWNPLSDNMIFIPRGGYQVGARLMNEDGKPIVVVRAFGPVMVNRDDGPGGHIRYGYLCTYPEDPEHPERQLFFEAWELYDENGARTHLRRVK
jgi:hypothetical protein